MSVTISGTTGVSKVQANTVDTTELVDDAVNAAKLDSTASPEFAGVYLGGTGAANYLDDYEEGTFTPSFAGLTIGNGTLSGTYTKIGNIVTAIFGFSCGSTTTVGTLGDITGLPFASSNDFTGYVKVHGVAFDSGARWYEAVAALGNNNSTVLVPSVPNYNSAITGTNPFTWTTNDNLVFTLTYRTA